MRYTAAFACYVTLQNCIHARARESLVGGRHNITPVQRRATFFPHTHPRALAPRFTKSGGIVIYNCAAGETRVSVYYSTTIASMRTGHAAMLNVNDNVLVKCEF